ncbi:cytochrome P450 [Gymnopus androsaceus JB14]|uniref:Cytochrome P450 n=1 Tax=Gymnopus androsaceus JB14 TaxID=1447944 RepID=A0A6A4HIY3_9AGAR|nr:cytochrome P450 [Gymnopus androsaceus JB14]
MNSLASWAAIIVVSLSLVHVVLRKRRIRRYLPPGPQADPLIGHLRKIPPVGQPEVFHEWAKKYGDVMYLEVLGRKIIILDTLEAANDLLDKRSAIYSCRPNFVVFNMMGWDRALPFIQYGKRFLLHRKLFQNYFGRQESMVFNPISYEESIVMVKNLMDRPKDYDKIIGRYTAYIVVKIAYGYSIKDDNDPMAILIDEVGKLIHNSGSPASTPVDFFPWLAHFPSWFPGTYYAEYARKWKSVTYEFINYPFNFTTKQLSEGKAQLSFLSKHLTDLETEEIEDEQDYIEDIKNATAQIYSAGADTSWGTLTVFLMAMVLHPECQAKAQAQIDAVCGPDRLPTFEDHESLPYVEYIMREVMRWHPIVPMGVPHRCLEDDVYNGMLIPAGSVLFANIRSMGWHEQIYKDAPKFNPDRYIPKSQGGREEPYLSPFGFGRRICPGRFLAESTVWMAMAMILATCNIGKAKDANGVEITPEVNFNVGIVNHLKPFKFTLVPRTAKASALVEEAHR